MQILKRLVKVTLAVSIIIMNSAFAKNDNRPIRVTLQSSAITLDPGGIQDTQSILVSRQINCQLFRSEGATFVFDAAESAKYVSPLRLVLKLNKNAKFHDGTLVTAEDVLASLNYIKSSRSVFTNLFQWIKRIELTDKSTIVFVLKKPAPQFLKVLSSTNYSIYKHDFLNKAKINKAMWRFPEGCGGYRVSGYGDHTINLMPISNGLPIEFVLKTKNQLTGDEAAQFDIVTLNVLGQEGAPDGFTAVNMFDPTQYYIGLNARSSAWHSKAERCQFLSSLDVGKLVSKYGSPSIVSDDLIPRDTLGYSKNAKYKQRIDEIARQTQVQGAKSKPHRFCLSYLTVSVQEKHKNEYIDMVNKVVPISEIRPISNVSHFGQKFVNSGCDAIFFGLGSNYFDGYEFLTVYEDNDANFTGIKDAWLSEQIKKSQMVGDADQRAKIYREIIHKIADLCVVMPLFTLPEKSIYVKNNIIAPGIGLVSFDEYYLGNVMRRQR